MKTVALLYDTSCIYEIVILNYFLKVTGKEMQFVSLDGKEITATEGYRIVPEDRLDSADPKDVELLVIPGGDIEKIDIPEVWKYLKSVKDLGGRIAAICAGVDDRIDAFRRKGCGNFRPDYHFESKRVCGFCNRSGETDGIVRR